MSADIGRALLQAAAKAAAKDPTALTWQSWVVMVVLAAALVGMIGDWIAADIAFAGMASIFCAARIIDVKQLAAGFSNTGVLTVVALYCVAEGIAQTGGLERIMLGVLGRKTNAFWGTIRLTLPCVLVSSVLNNTPIVAMLIPITLSWAARAGVDARQLLIPMTYSVTFGGTLTLIGTSTNLVVTGLMEKRYLDPAKLPPKTEAGFAAALAAAKQKASFGFFDITPYGIPYAVFGLLYLWFASGRLLPGARQNARRAAGAPIFALRLLPGSPAANKTVRAAGLKGLDALFLVSVGRQGHLTHAVSPDFLLLDGDVLYFSGDVRAASALAADKGFALVPADADSSVVGGDKTAGGLRLLSAGDEEGGGDRDLLPAGTKLVRAVVRKHGPLDGVRVTHAATAAPVLAGGDVVAVSRYGADAAPGLLADHVLADGDVVVLSLPAEFSTRAKPFRAALRDAETIPRDRQRTYVTALRVVKGGGLAGKRLGDTDLLTVMDVKLLAIDRAAEGAVDGTASQLRGDALTDDVVLSVGDTLYLSSGIEGISFLLRAPGLALAADDQVSKLGVSILERRLVQATVSVDSPLIGHTLREARFRATYDAVVVGVSRAGAPVGPDVRDVRLRAGDLLLLDAGAAFTAQHGADRAFSLVSEVPKSSPLKASLMWVAVALAFVMIATQIIGAPLKEAGIVKEELINLFPCAVLTAGAMLALRCLTPAQARRAIDLEVFLQIGFAFAVSTAMEVTGVAQLFANQFVRLSKAIGGNTAPLVAIYMTAGLLTEVLTNNATAALIYPIAARLGDSLKISPQIMAIAVMLGASDAFVSPFGYQCNLMSYSAGEFLFWWW